MARMKLLCVSAQIPGHLDWGGYLLTAAELAERGHDVIWTSGADVRSLVQKHGIPFRSQDQTGWRWPPPSPLPQDAALDVESIRQLKQSRALDQWLDVERVAAATDELLGLILETQPDVILSEMFTAAAGLGAEASDTPLIVIGWPAPADLPPASDSETPAMVMEARDRLRELLERYQLRGINWTHHGPPAMSSPLLHITYWSASWFGDKPLGGQTVHVGGASRASAAQPPDDIPSPDLAPWVLITLGTSFNRDPAFFANAVRATSLMHCLPIVVVGDGLDETWVQELIARLPNNAIVRDRINFDSILPYCAAAIHHGGAGTTHALIEYAIPQIVAPHAADQAYQAAGVIRSGVGLHIRPRQATVDALRIGLSALLPELSPYRTRAIDLQEEFQALGGIAKAADLVEQYATPKPNTENSPTGGSIASTD